jgi:DNA-binding transcriptional LysR family regulator
MHHGPLCAGCHRAAQAPIAQLERVDFAQCAAFPILPTPELSMHDLLQPLLAHHKRALQVLLETSSIELAKSLAERGVGIFFQSRLGLERELREGRLVHVPLDTPTTLYSELGVYVRAGRTLPSALDAFNRIVADAIESREDEESVALREWVARTQTTAVAASARS